MFTKANTGPRFHAGLSMCPCSAPGHCDGGQRIEITAQPSQSTPGPTSPSGSIPSPPPPKIPSTSTRRCTYRANGYRIRSLACKDRYLTVSSSCSVNTVALTTLANAPGARHQWNLSNVTSSTAGNVRSRRNCPNSFLNSSNKAGLSNPSSPSSRSVQHRVRPTSSASCLTVRMQSIGRSNGFLATTADCKGLRWVKTGTSTYTRFALDRV
jgi:hypothetical protein